MIVFSFILTVSARLLLVAMYVMAAMGEDTLQTARVAVAIALLGILFAEAGLAESRKRAMGVVSVALCLLTVGQAVYQIVLGAAGFLAEL